MGAVYSSYPPGYLIPPFLLEKLGGPRLSTDAASSMSRVHQFARLNHFLLVCIIGLTALTIAGQLSVALAAVLSGLFLPPFLLFQHNIWWVDLVGTTIAAFLFLLHVQSRKSAAPANRFQHSAFGLSVLAGSLVEWFTPMLAGALFFASGKRRRIFLAVAVAIAASFFIGQQQLLSGLALAAHKLRIRTGYEPAGHSIPTLILAWAENVRGLLGWPGLIAPLIAVAGAACLAEGRSRLRALWPVLAAVLFHWLAFSQHYAGHQYNMVRWAYLLALLPALYPGRAGLAVSALMAAYVISTYPLFQRALEASSSNISSSQLSGCRLVERHRAPERLFVSEQLHFSREVLGHIWLMPWCKTMVQEAHSLDDVTAALIRRALQFNFRARSIQRTFFLTQDSAPRWLPSPTEIDREGSWHLLEFKSEATNQHWLKF